MEQQLPKPVMSDARARQISRIQSQYDSYIQRNSNPHRYTLLPDATGQRRPTRGVATKLIKQDAKKIKEKNGVWVKETEAEDKMILLQENVVERFIFEACLTRIPKDMAAPQLSRRHTVQSSNANYALSAV
jgi:hypothetical protein